MLSKELQDRIKYIEIRTKRLLGGTRAGDHVTRQKGFGLDFDQIREYQQGDDVRYIDWKSTARSNKMLVKQYYQEQSRTIMLVVDCSPSLAYGSGESTKFECIATVACVLALVAHQTKDRVSLVLFGRDKIEYVPPKSGHAHVYNLMNIVFAHQPSMVHPKQVAMAPYEEVFRFVGSKKTHDTVVFLLSDFIKLDDSQGLQGLARSTEVTAVRCLDELEQSMKTVGLITLQDIATGELVDLDARTSQVAAINTVLQKRIEQQNAFFARIGIELFQATPERDMIEDLIRFFRKKAHA